MSERIARVEAFAIQLPRDVPYLGPLEPGVAPNARGYFVRPGNRTIYPANDRSVLIRIETASGAVGWGETYGIVGHGAVVNIIEDVLGPVIEGRDPRDPAVIAEDLYDLMRVRGFFGGHYVDAIAGIDIALWDLCGKLYGQPLARLLGGIRSPRIKAYVSGLPQPTLAERVECAQDWVSKGFDAIKFAGAVSREGEARELAALRAALGPSVRIACDLHWRYTAPEAIKAIRAMESHDLWFAEAPCAPEDIEGLAQVAASVATPVAGGEELRTRYEVRQRLTARGFAIVQPEMGHTGVSEFMAIAKLAGAFHCRVMPHATIGIGVFLAASLHAAAALPDVPYHEYQHSVFDRNLRYVTGGMRCAQGYYTLPDGAGLGVEPVADIRRYAIPA